MNDKYFNPPALDALTITVEAAQYRRPLYAVAIPSSSGTRTRWFCLDCLYEAFATGLAGVEYFSQNLRWLPPSREKLPGKMTVSNGRSPYIHRVSCVPVHACCSRSCSSRRPRSNSERDTPDWAAKPAHKR